MRSRAPSRRPLSTYSSTRAICLSSTMAPIGEAGSSGLPGCIARAHASTLLTKVS
ncbi:Uncharacterised protein [Bordetella pertussis]|nr:Uncharacterised protein [Bordetella pertussis]